MQSTEAPANKGRRHRGAGEFIYISQIPESVYRRATQPDDKFLNRGFWSRLATQTSCSFRAAA